MPYTYLTILTTDDKKVRWSFRFCNTFPVLQEHLKRYFAGQVAVYDGVDFTFDDYMNVFKHYHEFTPLSYRGELLVHTLGGTRQVINFALRTCENPGGEFYPLVSKKKVLDEWTSNAADSTIWTVGDVRLPIVYSDNKLHCPGLAYCTEDLRGSARHGYAHKAKEMDVWCEHKDKECSVVIRTNRDSVICTSVSCAACARAQLGQLLVDTSAKKKRMSQPVDTYYQVVTTVEKKKKEEKKTERTKTAKKETSTSATPM